MSNAESILARVSQVLGFSAPNVEVELAQKKTEDGTVVLDSDNFAVGEPIFIVTDDQKIPVPAGEYILEDGSMVAVNENGIIVEVGSKEGETQEETAEIENQNQPMKEQIADASEESAYSSAPKKVVKTKTEMEEQFFSHVKSVEARLSAIEKNNESLKAENIALAAENEELKKALNESPAEHSKFNPEAEANRTLQFKIGARREATITDRVFDQLF